MAEPYTDDELCEVRKRVGRLDLSQCRSCGKPIARERSVCKRLWYILIRVLRSATLRQI